ncbi:MAG: hypothetical protein JW755_10105 [Candidatus Aminicenantes bacterium]|nr:hypothetical protein [Candidatus Aminicenantes bacterium]
MKSINKKILIFSFLLAACFFILSGYENTPQKIAIAAKGETTDSQVESQGGRAQWLILFDDNGELIEALENPFYQEQSQAGAKSAEFLEKKNVTIFVAGNIGNNMARALDDFDITFISFTGTVEEAIAHVINTISNFYE